MPTSQKIIPGDCIAGLRTLPDASVHCCVTSPPYWGLRDYGTATWEGGDEACDHKPDIDHTAAVAAKSTLVGTKQEHASESRSSFRGTCGKCGARRIDSQLGLEPTPEAYVANMVAVFREVRRVLREDGTCWVNLGDSYGGGSLGRNDAGRNIGGRGGNKEGSGNPGRQGAVEIATGLKPKDLVGIPWRVAFALQADGWWLRQDIIWAKPNPMPESVTDRCTKAHEYVFLLTKSERYFYDAEAVSEAAATAGQKGLVFYPGRAGAMGRKPSGNEAKDPREGTRTTVRNRRSVWTITTKPYSGAHFAVMPPDLVEPCIKAGCPEGGTVLDPFAGSGTVLAVAAELGRNAIGCELNTDYIALAERRILAARQSVALFEAIA
jgi:DNA modification methylase